MIRKATIEDVGRVVQLLTEFHAESPYAWAPFDPEGTAAFVANMVERGVVFLSEDGVIGGCLYPLYFNPAVVLAAELFWFARVDGRKLREALEDWARDQGCAGVTCSGLANTREPTIRKLFARAGYDSTEVAFVKRFHP